ncbi:MAG: chromosomal replication initiator protein DnaA, partial [Muribaculaceae bacterium]|nr:chromosomal replication initiator protein DnaA [Muribaculaceae bacterium]
MTSNHQELWARCCEFIKENITPEQFNTWFRDIRSESYADGRLVLEVKSQFFYDQLEERYQKLIRSGVKKVYGDGVEIYYRVPVIPGDPSTLNVQRSSRP